MTENAAAATATEGAAAVSADVLDLMRSRHSVRAYTEQPIEAEKVAALQQAIDRANQAAGLGIRLVTNEPKAFDSMMAHYGKFANVRNYIVLAGPASDKLDELCGYWGEELVLLAQQLGLNTCWVAMTFARRKVRGTVSAGHKMALVISLGYGQTQGFTRKTKAASEVSNLTDASPAWFARGVEAAMLAPTATNQQSFYLELGEDCRTVRIQDKGGFYSKVDLGIIKHDFEAAAGKDNFAWA